MTGFDKGQKGEDTGSGALYSFQAIILSGCKVVARGERFRKFPYSSNYARNTVCGFECFDGGFQRDE